MTFSRKLSKKESNLIKGIAILVIIFHNYFHIIPPSPGENQFYFTALYFERFRQLVLAAPGSIFRYLFSFYGHYGVQLFVFISGYGLYLSFQKKEPSFLEFIRIRIQKIYPMLAIVVIFLLIAIPLWEGTVDGSKMKSLLLKFTLLFNFFPGEATAVTGPFWFFSLIFQLYLLFPLLANGMYKSNGKSALITGGICLLITILFNDYFATRGVSLYSLFIGQMPVFCLGMYLASRPRIVFPSWLVALCFLIFFAGNTIEIFWHFSFLACTVCALSVFFFIAPVVKKLPHLSGFLQFTGRISLYLFAIHGISRFPFEAISRYYDHDVITSILSLIYVAGVYGVAYGLKYVDAYIQTRLSGKEKWQKYQQKTRK